MAVSVSQGYILTTNLDNPGLMSVIESILANPVTNRLENGKVRYDLVELENSA